MAIAASASRPEQNSAIADIHSARNGRSVSKELPLTTNVGTAVKSSVAQSGCGEKRRASDHIAQTAITDQTRYAAWNGTSFTSPKMAMSAASVQAFSGGCG